MANEQTLREALELFLKHQPETNDDIVCGCSCGVNFPWRVESAQAWEGHVRSLVPLAAFEPRPDTDEGLSSEELAARWPGGSGRREPRQAGETKEWRTIIVGLPTIRKLLSGEAVELESFHINLIPDDVLRNNRPNKRLADPGTPKPREGGEK